MILNGFGQIIAHLMPYELYFQFMEVQDAGMREYGNDGSYYGTIPAPLP